MLDDLKVDLESKLPVINEDEEEYVVPKKPSEDPNSSVIGREQESLALKEEWVSEMFVDLPLSGHGKLVEFFFLGARMMCIFEDFQVQEIDIKSKTVTKSYNLQEIEGFEISEELEEDKVLAFTIEKDVQLMAVACMEFIHIFEYTEEPDGNSLSHITKVDLKGVNKLLFVEYVLIMAREDLELSQLVLQSFNLDSEEL